MTTTRILETSSKDGFFSVGELLDFLEGFPDSAMVDPTTHGQITAVSIVEYRNA